MGFVLTLVALRECPSPKERRNGSCRFKGRGRVGQRKSVRKTISGKESSARPVGINSNTQVRTVLGLDCAWGILFFIDEIVKKGGREKNVRGIVASVSTTVFPCEESRGIATNESFLGGDRRPK